MSEAPDGASVPVGTRVRVGDITGTVADPDGPDGQPSPGYRPAYEGVWIDYDEPIAWDGDEPPAVNGWFDAAEVARLDRELEVRLNVFLADIPRVASALHSAVKAALAASPEVRRLLGDTHVHIQTYADGSPVVWGNFGVSG